MKSSPASDDDFQEMLPSSVRTRFSDRVYWANTHLCQAGLVNRPSNGVLAINERGAAFRANHQERIEEAYEELRDSLAKELLDRIGASSATAFERLVIQLLVKMGYGGERPMQRSISAVLATVAWMA